MSMVADPNTAMTPQASTQPAQRSDESGDTFVQDFEALDAAASAAAQPSWLRESRRRAIQQFEIAGLPSTRDEDWRFTNVKPIREGGYRWQPSAEHAVGEADVRRFEFGELATHRLVFVDGRFAPNLSAVRDLPDGVVVASLAASLADHETLVKVSLGQLAKAETDPFTALNAAFIEDGAFVHVPAGVKVDLPIHLLYLATASQGDAPRATHPRNLVVAGAESSVTVIEDYASLGESTYLTNALTEVIVGDKADAHHYLIERENREACNITTLEVEQGNDTVFESHSLLIGGKLVRNNKRPKLNGEGGDSLINGLYLAEQDQHHDSHMRVHHAQPNCESRQFYKGILEHNGRTVFTGRIVVDPGAQKTDAKQSNQNLLLSDDAVADARPQLEIYADDVKCTHGATIGQIDEEAIFYLQSRGLSSEESYGLLVYAFAGEVLDRMSIEPVRKVMERLVLDHLPQGLVANIH